MSEKQNREVIMNNFENHLEQIKSQIKNEQEAMASNNDLAKNNAELKEQHEKLSLEIEEKSKLMEN